MRSAVKGALVLLVTLPMLAYVAGRLVAAPPDPGPRSPVILERSASPSPLPSPAASPPGNAPGGRTEPDDPDDPDPVGEDGEDGEDDEDDEGVRVVKPTPTRVGEDDAAPDAEDDDQTDDQTDDADDRGDD